MVDAFVSDCRRQHIRYVEAHFTPYNHERFGFGGRRALDIVTQRLAAQEDAGGPVVRLILDIPSESGPESGPYTAALLEEIANPLVVAIGLGGPEDGFPRTLVAPYFDRARRAGYAAVAHAGETGGAEHVRQAVEELGVRRVQHGVRAVDDPAVVRLLAARQVCCDVALTSNTFLTPYRDLATHPVRAPPGRGRAGDALHGRPALLRDGPLPRVRAGAHGGRAQRGRAVADRPQRPPLRPGRDRPAAAAVARVRGRRAGRRARDGARRYNRAHRQPLGGAP
jgi:hypothetical protein